MFKRVVFYISGISLLILGFQNCGGVSFNDTSVDGVLAAKQSDSLPEDLASGQIRQAQNQEDDVVEDQDNDSQESPDAGLYVCILEGSGKSIRLGYVDGKLEGKLATPQDVCMTKRACTEIVSRAFAVKGPQKRGFCPDKNPHVVHFSDAQLNAMIEEMLKK